MTQDKTVTEMGRPDTAWFGFWIFLAVYVACEAWLYSQGHETLFWQHKTDVEKQIQQQATGCLK